MFGEDENTLYGGRFLQTYERKDILRQMVWSYAGCKELKVSLCAEAVGF